MLLELLVGSEDVVSILADVSCPLKQHVLQACYQCLVMFFETHTTAGVLPCDQFPAVVAGRLLKVVYSLFSQRV